MADKDYYVILGVPRSESAEGIRDAFRALARRHHPDRAGPRATPHFQEINEAYHVLSDERRRADYDAELERREGPRRPRRSPPASTRGVVPVEPLVPSEAAPERAWRRPGPFEPVGSRRVICLDVELSESEAREGVELPLDVPIRERCGWCRGMGLLARRCTACRGRGLLERPGQVKVAIGPGVRHGSVMSVPLRRVGVDAVTLELRFLVA